MLAGWTFAVALRSAATCPRAMVARVLGVMGLVSVGFLLFMLLTSQSVRCASCPPPPTAAT